MPYQIRYIDVKQAVKRYSPWHVIFSSVQFSLSVMSNSLRPHALKHAGPPCPSPSPGVHPNPCPLNWWFHPTISSSVVPFSSCPQIFPSIRVFSNESAVWIRWPKYWSYAHFFAPLFMIKWCLQGQMALLQSPVLLLILLKYGSILCHLVNRWSVEYGALEPREA